MAVNSLNSARSQSLKFSSRRQSLRVSPNLLCNSQESWGTYLTPPPGVCGPIPFSGNYSFRRSSGGNSVRGSIRDRGSRNNSVFSFAEGPPLKDLPPKEQRHRKAAWAVVLGSTTLFLLALACVMISLHGYTKIEQKGHRKGFDRPFG